MVFCGVFCPKIKWVVLPFLRLVGVVVVILR